MSRNGHTKHRDSGGIADEKKEKDSLEIMKQHVLNFVSMNNFILHDFLVGGVSENTAVSSFSKECSK